MADPVFYAGKSGYVVIDEAGGETWAFSKWGHRASAVILKRNTFKAGGYNRNIAGFKGTSVSLSGPYDAAPPASLEPGEKYRVFLGIEEDGPTDFLIDFRVGEISLENDAEDGPMWTVTGESDGVIDLTFPQ